MVTTTERAQALANKHGVSKAAAELLLASDVLDLHIDTFIPPRLPLVRYDVTKHHERGFLGGRFFGHLDIPRVLESGLTGAMWSITTNPFRRASRRWVVFQKNLETFKAMVAAQEGRLEIVCTVAEYRAARARGAHAVILAIQGGNALERSPAGLDSIAPLVDPAVSPSAAVAGGPAVSPSAAVAGGPAVSPSAAVAGAPGRPSPIVRVTLVHLTNAAYGITSSPFRLWKGKRGLTDIGRDFVRHLNAHKVFVDLAHINAQGFWDAVETHDKSQPLIATHTGVSGVKPHWRNLDDRQVKAVADTGGVIGVIYSRAFLKVRGGPDDAGMIVDHMAHVANIAGEDAVAIGSDYDGAIVPPKDLRSGNSYVRLVQKMLDRGFSEARVQKILGLNFLRSFERLRG